MDFMRSRRACPELAEVEAFTQSLSCLAEAPSEVEEEVEGSEPSAEIPSESRELAEVF